MGPDWISIVSLLLIGGVIGCGSTIAAFYVRHRAHSTIDPKRHSELMERIEHRLDAVEERVEYSERIVDAKSGQDRNTL